MLINLKERIKNERVTWCELVSLSEGVILTQAALMIENLGMIKLNPLTLRSD